jgi:hypothetical protein
MFFLATQRSWQLQLAAKPSFNYNVIAFIFQKPVAKHKAIALLCVVLNHIDLLSRKLEGLDPTKA